MTREPDTKRHLRPAPFPEVSLGEYLPNGAERRVNNEERQTGPASSSALSGALQRLEEAIDLETSALEAHDTIDIEEFNRRKSRSLLELTRLTRNLPDGWEQHHQEDLTRLQEKLERNQTTVKLHLGAVQEIADLMANALHEAESDGTYGQSMPRGAAA